MVKNQIHCILINSKNYDTKCFIILNENAINFFQKIPDPMGVTMESAHHEDNKMKNRYKNVSPCKKLLKNYQIMI